MGCASSKKRTTSIDDLTGQAKNKEPSVPAGKNKNGQVASSGNDVKPIKKESSKQTSAAPPSHNDAIQIPGTHKSFLAPDGIPFIDEDVDEDGETVGVNSIPVDSAVIKPDVNKNVVKGPAVPDQKPKEEARQPTSAVSVTKDDNVKPAAVIDERQLPASVSSEEQAEEERKRAVAMEILSKELDIFTASGHHHETTTTTTTVTESATTITVTESEPVAAEDSSTISQPVRSVTPDDQEKAAVKIQAGLRGYRDRQRVKAIRAAKETSGEASLELSNQQSDELLDAHDESVHDANPEGARISGEINVANQQDDPDDPQKQRAATKIQASFKGYKTRKEMGKIKK